MNNRIGHFWQQLRESLWFVPGMLVLVSFGLAYGLVEFDTNTAWKGKKQFPLLFGNGAEGARGMLTAIAGSMLTVAALTFSLTLSTISQVSSQYSPRVLRNFMSDRINQFIMGYFVSVFAYCLIVLGTIRGSDEGQFVPATAVVVGLLLALGGVAALIVFIHHIAESLQTGTIVSHIFSETSKAIDILYPATVGEPLKEPHYDEDAFRLIDEPSGWWGVKAKQVGYLQLIDTSGLLQWATRHQVIVRQEKEVGSFLGEGTIVFSVRPENGDSEPNKDDWPGDLLTYITIGKHRSIDQDVSFGIQQLVDIILKALSPGINDTTTAIMTIDFLGAVGERLAGRTFPSRLRSDSDSLRLIVASRSFEQFIQLTFDLPRINAKGNHAVLQRLLRALALVNNAICSADRKPVLIRQVSLLLACAEQSLESDYEKQHVLNVYAHLMKSWS